MLPPFDLLYERALSDRNLVLWLGNRTDIERYTRAVEKMEEEETAILSELTGPVRERFLRYVEYRNTESQLSGEMLFTQAVSMGVHLGLPFTYWEP